MACSDISSVTQALIDGQFFYILCPYEAQIGVLAFPIIIFVALAIGLSVQNQSVIPFTVFGLIGGTAILLNSTTSFGLFNQILYLAIIGAITASIYLLLKRFSGT